MKVIWCLFLLLGLFSCSKDKVVEESFKAISYDKRDSAFLDLYTSENKFWGNYQVFYFDKKKDTGRVDGEIFGDTLKGTYRFISRDNSKMLEPIIFKRAGTGIQLGKGDKYIYFGIPFYKENTIKYGDSLFQFVRIPEKG